MFKTRVLTALVLIPLFLGALFGLPEKSWGIFCAVIMTIAASEWRQLSGMTERLALIFPCVTALVFLGLVYSPLSIYYLQGIFAAGSVFWVVVAPCWLAKKWSLQRLGTMNALLGWALLLPAGLAMLQLRGDGWLLLSVMMVAWVADTFAYFSGRLFGRHKLAPAISPGKTWEGAAGALVAVCVYCWFLPKPFTFFPDTAWALDPVTQKLIWMLGGVLLMLVSVLGDLLESLFKRQIGLKDSGRLLPGHGGILDRIDSLLAILPLAAAIYLTHDLFFVMPLGR